jgi:hypothetical protein
MSACEYLNVVRASIAGCDATSAMEVVGQGYQWIGPHSGVFSSHQSNLDPKAYQRVVRAHSNDAQEWAMC